MERVKRKSTVKLPARAGIWSIISGLVSRGIGVVGTPIFTRLLTPEEYGVYPHYTTWLSLLASIVISSLAGSAIYRGLQRYSDRKEEFISGATGLGLFIGIIFFVAAIILRDLLVELTGLSFILIMMMVIEVSLSSVLAFRSALLRYEYKYKALSLINLSTSVLTPLVALLFVFLTPWRSEARILGSLIAALAVALPLLIRAKGGGRLYNREIWRYLCRVNLPMLPHYLSSGLILRISEIVIGRSHGGAALAKYSVGISVGLALSFLTNALTQVISPWIIRKERGGEWEEIRKTLTLALGLLAMATLVVLAVAPEILAIMTPSEYSDALPTVYPLALSVGAMFLSNCISSAEAYYERSLRTSVPTIVTAILTTVVTVTLLPGLDYRISALFTLAAYVILAVLSGLMFKSLSGKSIVSLPKCILLLSFSVFYAYFLFVCRESLSTRIILSLPLLPVLLILLYKTYKQVLERG